MCNFKICKDIKVIFKICKDINENFLIIENEEGKRFSLGRINIVMTKIILKSVKKSIY